MVIDDNTEFEWSDEKNRSNIKDHHISFEEAVWVFADEFMIGAEGVYTPPLCGEKRVCTPECNFSWTTTYPAACGVVD